MCNWIKCGDRVPPDDECVFLSNGQEIQIGSYLAIHIS